MSLCCSSLKVAFFYHLCIIVPFKDNCDANVKRLAFPYFGRNPKLHWNSTGRLVCTVPRTAWVRPGASMGQGASHTDGLFGSAPSIQQAQIQVPHADQNRTNGSIQTPFLSLSWTTSWTALYPPCSSLLPSSCPELPPHQPNSTSTQMAH